MVGENALRARLNRNLIYIPVVALALVMLLPYYWMAIGAFKPIPELSRTPPSFFVENPTFNNFYDELGGKGLPEHVEGIFQRFQDTSGGFARYYLNSIFVTVSVTIGSLILASLAAYILAKHRFPGRNIFFMLFVASMMVPWQVTIIPGFLMMKEFNWINTFTALIIPALPKAFVVFFLRQYMISLPDELLDAARIDGAGEFRIWWRIILPLVRPALTAMSIFVLLGEWNNFMWPLIVMQSSENRTLPLALSLLSSTFNGANTMGVLMAAALLVSLPTLVLFLIFQKQFIRGIALTGIKG
ncbi:MAG: carbohydrate ABC transporter permease [Anaerolineae bacterium]|nr:carbohydrate ABC transporter permease [Anaerolineae bacterium]CAG0978232.1 L-arabinose transport system permease protein AraQ [Anaerolineae bacterium]